VLKEFDHSSLVQLILKEWEKGQRLAEPVVTHQERTHFLKEVVNLSSAEYDAMEEI
jgi:hypothetical protein